MSKRNYRTYTKEFKLEALELLENSEKSAPQIERDLGITPGLLTKWRTRYQAIKQSGEGEKMTLEPTDIEAARREIRRLKRELAGVKEDREILKKAISIFSQKGKRGTNS